MSETHNFGGTQTRCMDVTEGEALCGCLQRVLELLSENSYNVSIDQICNPEFNFKKLYLKMSVKCHPDKGGDPEDFKALNEANQFVNDYVKNSGHRGCCVAFVLNYCADPEGTMQNIRAQQAKFDEEAKQVKKRKRQHKKNTPSNKKSTGVCNPEGISTDSNIDTACTVDINSIGNKEELIERVICFFRSFAVIAKTIGILPSDFDETKITKNTKIIKSSSQNKKSSAKALRAEYLNGKTIINIIDVICHPKGTGSAKNKYGLSGSITSKENWKAILDNFGVPTKKVKIDKEFKVTDLLQTKKEDLTFDM